MSKIEAGKLDIDVERFNPARVIQDVRSIMEIRASEKDLQLFQPFSQGDHRVNREFGGTGLGLAISQRLATMLGGTIRHQSQAGKGSTFSVNGAVGNIKGVEFSLPVNFLAPVTKPTSRPHQPLDCNVLVVDDRRDIRFLSRKFPGDADATVEEAEDGELAVEAVKASMINGNEFDLIVLNMQMPKLDGYETAKPQTRLRRTDLIFFQAQRCSQITAKGPGWYENPVAWLQLIICGRIAQLHYLVITNLHDRPTTAAS